MSSYITGAYQQMQNVYEGVKSPPYEKLDGLLSTGESYFNKLGYIPGISIMTGQAREAFGWFEVILGVSSGGLRNIAAGFQKDEAAKEKLYKQAEVDFSYAINGLGNVVRGNIEKFPLWDLYATAINKLVLVVYDFFQVRMNYGHEAASHGDTPYKNPLLRSFSQPKELEIECEQGKWFDDPSKVATHDSGDPAVSKVLDLDARLKENAF